MKLTKVFELQLQDEAARTRRALERVPEGRDEWKPHEKSMPLGHAGRENAVLVGADHQPRRAGSEPGRRFEYQPASAAHQRRIGAGARRGRR